MRGTLARCSNVFTDLFSFQPAREEHAMDFQITDEQRMIYEYGKRLVKRFDRKYWVEKARARAFPAEMYQQAADDGFVGMMVAEEYGGAGLGMLEMALLQEGLSNEGIPLLSLIVGATMSMGLISDHGTEQQKRTYLPGACRGDIRFCFAVTEADAGTNTINVTSLTRSSRNPGRYTLNGRKTFITDAECAEYMIVVTRSTALKDVQRKTDGFTLVLVDTKAKGIEVRPIDISIEVPEDKYTVFFDDVDIGPENIIGDLNKGFDILFESLNPERIIISAVCTGLGRYALRRAVEYANERVVFKGPIGAYQALQHPLARAKTDIELASLMMRKAAWLFDRGEPCGTESNMAKYASSEAGILAVDSALQCFGGNGFTKEYGIFDIYPVVRLFRTAPLNSEMVLNYIAERDLGLPRSY